MSALTSEALSELESQVRAALASGDEGALVVLGYGEISTVLACEGHACKRLPPFPSRAALEAYQATFDDYLEALRDAGCAVLESRLETTPNADGSITVWCVQPLVDPTTFVPSVLERATEATAAQLIDSLVTTIASVVSPTCGLDAQASNWVYEDGELRYLDVTTPMLRDAEGVELLNTDLFLASLPWALRGAVKRLLLGEILDKYYDPRGALLDLAGNLLKEGLSESVDPLLERANGIVDPTIERSEVEAYYREDARMWALLQRLRRGDRWWQQRVRRRIYPFLLPGEIERRV